MNSQARDMLINSQPVLWAQALLEDAEKVSGEARNAILARVGVELFFRFAVFGDFGAVNTTPRAASSAGAVWAASSAGETPE